MKFFNFHSERGKTRSTFLRWCNAAEKKLKNEIINGWDENLDLGCKPLFDFKFELRVPAKFLL
jgi:hypothetical protein